MATVEIYQDESDKKEWRWRVKADDGTIIGKSSEGFARKDHTGNNLASLPKYARETDIKTAAAAPDPRPEGSQLPLEFYKDDDGEWRWRITARNGKIVHASVKGWEDKAGAKSNLEGLLKVISGWSPS